MFSSFTFAIGAHSISEEVAGFCPLWFPQDKLRRRNYVAAKARDSYFLGLSSQSISKSMLG